MLELEVPSGAQVILNPASFEAASLLHRALLREMVAFPDFGLMGAFHAAGSEQITTLLWPCLAKCLYNNQKIVPMTFLPVEARQDFYPIAKACIDLNIGPLFDGLRSEWNKYQAQAKTESSPKESATPESPSTTT